MYSQNVRFFCLWFQIGRLILDLRCKTILLLNNKVHYGIDADCYSRTTRVGVHRFRQNEKLRLGWIFVSAKSIFYLVLLCFNSFDLCLIFIRHYHYCHRNVLFGIKAVKSIQCNINIIVGENKNNFFDGNK